VLQSGEYLISSTLWVRRSNITVDGAWPWPVLRRSVGFTQELMYTDSGSNPSWVTIRNIYFDGNRYNGATSTSFELNLYGCSYCMVTGNALFISSPYFALGTDNTKPQAVTYVNLQGLEYLGIYTSNGGTQCSDASGWSPSRCLNVSNSWFYSIGVNAIGFDLNNALIAYNSFNYNHTKCLFGAPGGQIDLDTGSNDVLVQNNSFTNGPSCPNDFWAVGVELHGSNIALVDNVIQNNTGEGIYMEGVHNISVSSTNPSAYPISNNNERGHGYNGCWGFPAIRIHTMTGKPQSETITISNLWLTAGQSYGVEASACRTGSGPPVLGLTVQNNCVAGNLVGGLYLPAAWYPALSNNQTSGCGGY